MTLPTIGIALVHGVGWMFGVIGAEGMIVGIPLGLAVTGVAVLGGLALGGCAVVLGSVALCQWAHRLAALNGFVKVPKSTVDQHRAREQFNPAMIHTAVCGPAGSGKSSIVNALMGMHNGQQGAAEVGTTETTIVRARYRAHRTLGHQLLYDFPGAGTLLTPSKNYYYDHRLWLFDRVLIVHGQRFTEVEVATVAACILNQQEFAIVRTRSEQMVGDVQGDTGLDANEARRKHLGDTMKAVEKELTTADCPKAEIAKLLNLVCLVDKRSLRTLAASDQEHWPNPPGTNEFHERPLIEFLRRERQKGGEQNEEKS